MDTASNTRNIVKLNEQHISELEQAVAAATASFEQEMASAEELTQEQKEEYIAEVKKQFDAAYTTVEAHGPTPATLTAVQQLAATVSDLNSAHFVNNTALIAQQQTLAEQYATALDEAFEGRFLHIAALLEKRSKDYYSKLEGSVNTTAIDSAKAFVQKRRKDYKKAKRSRKRDEVQEFLIERFEEYEGLIKSATAQERELEALDSNPFRLPIRVHYIGDKPVEITLPILKDTVAQSNGLLKIVHEALSEKSTAPVARSSLAQYALNPSTNHLPAGITEVLNGLEALKQANVTPLIIETKVPELAGYVPESVQPRLPVSIPSPDTYTLSIEAVAEHHGVSVGSARAKVYKNKELMETYSKLVIDPNRKGRTRRLFSEEILSMPEIFERKRQGRKPKSAQQETTPQPPEAPAVPDDLKRQGDMYLKRHLERPTTQAWLREFGKPSLDKVVDQFGSFEAFADELCGVAVEPKKSGKKYNLSSVVSDLEKGLSTKAIAKKHSIHHQTIASIRKRSGVWNAQYIKSQYGTIDDIADKKMQGVTAYPKDAVREKIILEAIDQLPDDTEITYCGLEGAHFGSYIRINSVYQVNPRKSLIAENNKLDWRIMRSLVKNWQSISDGKTYQFGGEIFKGLNVYDGNMLAAVENAAEKKSKSQFNLLNLDYNGCLTEEKTETWRLLFKHKLIADEALMFVTLNNSKYMQERLLTGTGHIDEKAYGTRDQEGLVDAHLLRYAKRHGYAIDKVGKSHQYTSNKTPMLFMGYKITRGNKK